MTIISSNLITLRNCNMRDVNDSVKAIKLLKKETIEIVISTIVDDDVIVTLKNNRFYLNGMILPKCDIFKCVYIYFE